MLSMNSVTKWSKSRTWFLATGFNIALEKSLGRSKINRTGWNWTEIFSFWSTLLLPLPVSSSVHAEKVNYCAKAKVGQTNPLTERLRTTTRDCWSDKASSHIRLDHLIDSPISSVIKVGSQSTSQSVKGGVMGQLQKARQQTQRKLYSPEFVLSDRITIAL
jgi:hypothetical protein